MTETKAKIDYFEQLRKNWVIVAFIVSLIVAWTNIQADIKSTNKDVASLQVDNVALELKISQYQRQVSDISGDIKAIKESLTFIKDKIK